MAETSPAATKPATAGELIEVIQEFEEYRERLINETTTAAKKAKLPKAMVMKQLEPELAKIDAALENLRTQQAAIEEAN
ncbi:hypothetical protein IQ235_03005 [Oscillatoriales cyanobacterium LEGE 11467]|uniref:Uncharacterized protein n=1 Tax=Zarconia navalis LEGE 11467 TaxID=1828826 RepID=A0A928Z8E1_9CYAN|nr:hypothetical protein [Zarconia navalis]MBE9039761.1 hypothetical protein [Zarconia navalis LEGE 11467]